MAYAVIAAGIAVTQPRYGLPPVWVYLTRGRRGILNGRYRRIAVGARLIGDGLLSDLTADLARQ
jgi:hypothetical protein